MQKNTLNQTILLVLLLFSQVCLGQVNKAPIHKPPNDDILILQPNADNFMGDEIEGPQSASHEAYSEINNNSSIDEEMD